MKDDMFQDRRARRERRASPALHGIIHCRRKVRDRRRRENLEQSRPWWLQTNYVVRERLLCWER